VAAERGALAAKAAGPDAAAVALAERQTAAEPDAAAEWDAPAALDAVAGPDAPAALDAAAGLDGVAASPAFFALTDSPERLGRAIAGRTARAPHERQPERSRRWTELCSPTEKHA
jgi:hypothetical protein